MSNEMLYNLVMSKQNRGEAAETLKDQKLTKPQLISLCKEYCIHIRPSDNKEHLIESFVNSTLGAYLTVQAIRNTDLGKRI